MVDHPNEPVVAPDPQPDTTLRRPNRLHFRAPASAEGWRMTGRINWPPLERRYNTPPTCEWISNEGYRMWLPAQYMDVVIDAGLEGKQHVPRSAAWSRPLRE